MEKKDNDKIKKVGPNVERLCLDMPPGRQNLRTGTVCHGMDRNVHARPDIMSCLSILND